MNINLLAIKTSVLDVKLNNEDSDYVDWTKERRKGRVFLYPLNEKQDFHLRIEP